MSAKHSMAPENTFDSLSNGEREAIFRLLAWLATRGGVRGEQQLSHLEEVAEQLGLQRANLSTKLDTLEEIESVGELARGIETDWVRKLLVGQLIAVAWVGSNYDARERVGIRRICRAMDVPDSELASAEAKIVETLREIESEGLEANDESNTGDYAKIAAGVVAGGGLLALTGGLAAPAIGGAIGSTLGLSGAAATSAGLAAIGGGSLAAGGFGVAGGTAVVTGGLGIVGAGAGGHAMWKRSKDVDDIEVIDMGNEGAPVVLGVSGFLSQNSDFRDDWSVLEEWAPETDGKALRWEAQANKDLYKAVGGALGKQGAKKCVEHFAKQATKSAGRTLAWPTWALQAIDALANPWTVARNLAEETGKVVADAIADRHWGPRPVTLVGFSLGTRVIVEALNKMDNQTIASSVERVVLMGGAVGREHVDWAEIAQTVPGGFVNAYSTDDWVLGGLYRAAEWFEKPIGLAPLEADGVINVDVTEPASGHFDYRKNMIDVFSRVDTALRKR